MSGPSKSTETSQDRSQAPICYYGDRIKLWGVSAYGVSATDRRGGFIGAYHKAGRYGVLSCVPPLGQPYQALYEPAVYTILDPNVPLQPVMSTAVTPYHPAPRKPLRYGDEFILMDQDGYTLNNR